MKKKKTQPNFSEKKKEKTHEPNLTNMLSNRQFRKEEMILVRTQKKAQGPNLTNMLANLQFRKEKRNNAKDEEEKDTEKDAGAQFNQFLLLLSQLLVQPASSHSCHHKFYLKENTNISQTICI